MKEITTPSAGALRAATYIVMACPIQLRRFYREQEAGWVQDFAAIIDREMGRTPIPLSIIDEEDAP